LGGTIEGCNNSEGLNAELEDAISM
jgi:hypothetical protein